VSELNTGTVRVKTIIDGVEYTDPRICAAYMAGYNTANEENKKLRAALEEILPMCGNPSAVDACRLIANKCQEALK